MSEKQPTFPHKSTKTTANEPVEAIDPGGTHSTKPSGRGEAGPDASESAQQPRVGSGDRNPQRESRTAQPK